MKPKTKGGQILLKRRKGALKRLEEQLELGHKNTKTGMEPLDDHDVIRISKEMEVLKTRV